MWVGPGLAIFRVRMRVGTVCFNWNNTVWVGLVLAIMYIPERYFCCLFCEL